MKNLKIQNPELMMFKHGKSFHFAAQVFSRDTFQRIIYLYAFCRFIDDTADEQKPESALKDLTAINQILNSGQTVASSRVPTEASEITVKELIQKLFDFNLKRSYLQVLVDGALFDVNSQKIVTLKDLLRYCYHVAGVVGLMMCPLILVFKKKAFAFAIDLGIGMQITNICRDVLEDAKNNRTYLPSDDLHIAGLSIEDLKVSGPTPDKLKNLIENYLNLADVYYESSFYGFAYIPLRPRIAILYASEIYKAIGKKLRRQDYNVLHGRVYLSKTEKFFVCFISTFKMLHPRFWFAGIHNPKLHTSLHDLPEVD